MIGWIDGWMEGWMLGWMDVYMVGFKPDEWIHDSIVGCLIHV